jgi:hypothetical protein
MTVSGYYRWFRKNWPYAGLPLAAYLTVFAVLFVRPVNFPAFLIILMTPLYMIHETEEYIFPGGFGDFFNRRIFGIEAENGPMGETFIFAINVGAGLVSSSVVRHLVVLPIGTRALGSVFRLFAGLAHIPLSIKGRKLYNPGLVVSLLLNIPGGAAVIWYLSAQGIIRQPLMNYHLLIGLGLNLLLPVMGLIVFRRYQRRTHQEASAHG